MTIEQNNQDELINEREESRDAWQVVNEVFGAKQEKTKQDVQKLVEQGKASYDPSMAHAC